MLLRRYKQSLENKEEAVELAPSLGEQVQVEPEQEVAESDEGEEDEKKPDGNGELEGELDEPVKMDLSKSSNDKLKTLLDERGIKYNKNAKKAELLELLK